MTPQPGQSLSRNIRVVASGLRVFVAVVSPFPLLLIMPQGLKYQFSIIKYIGI